MAGKTLGPVELALGYGDPKTTPRYLDGAFGAVSYRPLPWLNLMAEHDSQDVRLGVGASSPQGWLPYGLQVKAKVLAYDEGDSDNGRNFFSVGVSLPFGNAPSKQRLQLVGGGRRCSISVNANRYCRARVRKCREPTVERFSNKRSVS